MPKQFIRRYLPDPRRITAHKQLRWFGKLLHDPNLWHLNRRSVSVAMGVGMFLNFVPFPGQTIMAVAAAIWLRVNLPVTFVMVWISNPVTMPPIFFFTYKVGAWMLGLPAPPLYFEMSLDWFVNGAIHIIPPLVLGSLSIGTLLGLSVYAMARLFWRFHIIFRWRCSRAKFHNR